MENGLADFIRVLTRVCILVRASWTFLGSVLNDFHFYYLQQSRYGPVEFYTTNDILDHLGMDCLPYAEVREFEKGEVSVCRLRN